LAGSSGGTAVQSRYWITSSAVASRRRVDEDRRLSEQPIENFVDCLKPNCFNF
jgi:hypothetical protein